MAKILIIGDKNIETMIETYAYLLFDKGDTSVRVIYEDFKKEPFLTRQIAIYESVLKGNRYDNILIISNNDSAVIMVKNLLCEFYYEYCNRQMDMRIITGDEKEIREAIIMYSSIFDRDAYFEEILINFISKMANEDKYIGICQRCGKRFSKRLHYKLFICDDCDEEALNVIKKRPIFLDKKFSIPKEKGEE